MASPDFFHLPMESKLSLLTYLQKTIPCNGLIQKEKVDINGEKNAEISTVPKKTVAQRWLQIMIMELTQATFYNYLVVFSLLCSYYVTNTISKLELRLTVIIILFKIEFGQAQSSVPEIGKQMLKTACFNPACCNTFQQHKTSTQNSDSKWLMTSFMIELVKR